MTGFTGRSRMSSTNSELRKTLFTSRRTDPAHHLQRAVFRACGSPCVVLALSAHPKTPNEIRFQYQEGLIWLKAHGILGMDFFRGRIVQIDFARRRLRLVVRDSLSLADGEILPIRIWNDVFCVPVRVAENPAQWIRLDTGCDASLVWVVSDPGKRLTEGTSVGLSHSSRNCVKTTVR